MDDTTPLIIIDAANVVGSTPDGWWRDRKAATTRLRDRLAGLAHTGLPRGPDWARHGHLDVIMVTEGRAGGVPGRDTVTIVQAPASGDDTIVDLVQHAAPTRDCLVVTSDRALRHRVETAGGHVTGASTLTRSSHTTPPTRHRPRPM